IATRRVPPPATHEDIIELGEADAPEMLALATLTEPGPFLARTHTMGRFIGIRVAGGLRAMAGERVRFPRYTWARSVCTHPLFRGGGVAVGLAAGGEGASLARLERLFLHRGKTSRGPISMYESPGFALRSEVTDAVQERGGGAGAGPPAAKACSRDRG